MILLILQQVPDLSQQYFLGGGCGRRGGLSSSGLFFLLFADLGELVQALDQPEHHQCQNGKVDDCGDEVAVGQIVLDFRTISLPAAFTMVS